MWNNYSNKQQDELLNKNDISTEEIDIYPRDSLSDYSNNTYTQSDDDDDDDDDNQHKFYTVKKIRKAKFYHLNYTQKKENFKFFF